MAFSQASGSSTSCWSSIFPPQVSNWDQSLKFVKKLLAVGVSTIAYLRFNIPEESFAPIDMDGVRVMILRSKSENSVAKDLIDMIRSAIDPLEKGFLRELILTVYLDDPDNVYEMYSFAFNHDGLTMSQGSPGERPTSLFQGSITNPNELLLATKSLLKTMIYITQDLDILPEEAYLGIKISYHEDITPPDYHAPGFVPCSPERVEQFRRSAEASKDVNLGNVATKWHSMSGSIRSMSKTEVQASTQEVRYEQLVRGPAAAGDSFQMENLFEETARILGQYSLPVPQTSEVANPLSRSKYKNLHRASRSNKLAI